MCDVAEMVTQIVFRGKLEEEGVPRDHPSRRPPRVELALGRWNWRWVDGLALGRWNGVRSVLGRWVGGLAFGQ